MRPKQPFDGLATNKPAEWTSFEAGPAVYLIMKYFTLQSNWHKMYPWNRRRHPSPYPEYCATRSHGSQRLPPRSPSLSSRSSPFCFSSCGGSTKRASHCQFPAVPLPSDAPRSCGRMRRRPTSSRSPRVETTGAGVGWYPATRSQRTCRRNICLPRGERRLQASGLAHAIVLQAGPALVHTHSVSDAMVSPDSVHIRLCCSEPEGAL